MNRIALVLIASVFAILSFGCGMSDPPVPEDRSNLPPEVKAEEERFEAANAKRAAEFDKRAGKARSR